MEERTSVDEMIAAVCDEPTGQPEPEAESSAQEEITETAGAEPEEQEEGQAEAEDSDDSQAELAGEKPRKTSKEKRINQLTWKLREQERQAEYWRQQAEARAEQTQQPAQADQEPIIDDYAVYEDYVRELARYQARQIVAEETRRMQEAQTRQTQEREQQERLTRAKKEVDKAAERYDDFYDALDVVTALPLPSVTSDAIMDSPVVAEIIYHLGKNPQEAERIAALPQLAQIKEIGKLEDKIASWQTLKQKQVKQPTRVENAGDGIPQKGPDLEALWRHGKKTGDYTDYYKATGII